MTPPPTLDRRALDRPVALIGLMGAGKTTVGQRLATRLHVPFVDADRAIEEAARMSVADIFEAFGEAGFRDGERRVIARLVDGAPLVLATGGGAWMDADTRALLLDRALVVWLRADINVLVERVSRRSHRPLLVGRDPGVVLRELAAKRHPLYALAHLAVDSGDRPHEATVRAVAERIGEWQRRAA